MSNTTVSLADKKVGTIAFGHRHTIYHTNAAHSPYFGIVDRPKLHLGEFLLLRKNSTNYNIIFPTASKNRYAFHLH